MCVVRPVVEVGEELARPWISVDVTPCEIVDQIGGARPAAGFGFQLVEDVPPVVTSWFEVGDVRQKKEIGCYDKNQKYDRSITLDSMISFPHRPLIPQHNESVLQARFSAGVATRKGGCGGSALQEGKHLKQLVGVHRGDIEL